MSMKAITLECIELGVINLAYLNDKVEGRTLPLSISVKVTLINKPGHSRALQATQIRPLHSKTERGNRSELTWWVWISEDGHYEKTGYAICPKTAFFPPILVEKLDKAFTDVPKFVLRKGSKSQNSYYPDSSPFRVSFLASMRGANVGRSFVLSLP
ncbi:hypothetical protein AVEN_99487-1, partial [Araneus ventricosus]